MPYFSIIIPAYNEEARIGPTLERIGEYMRSSGMDYEIIVVDDGSTDDTRAVVSDAARRISGLRLVEDRVNRGKGFSVKNGFLNSSGRLVLFTDADLSTPIEELERFLPEAERGADIVIGSRSLKGSNIIKRQPFYRVLMGKTFNKLVRLLTVSGLVDTQCGFKLFRRDTCEPIFRAQRVERFAFDVEILFLAQKKGLKISELPVKWINSPQSKVHPVRDSLRMAFDLLQIRMNYFVGKYRI